MLTRPLRRPCILVFSIAILTASTIAQPKNCRAQNSETRRLTIEYGTEAPAIITPELWARLPRISVKVPTEGGETSYEGVTMPELLKLVKAPLGKELRGKMLAKYVLIEAADDYRVVFSLPEVDPESTTQVVIVADRRDGKPLDAKEGPYRVIVPAEKKHARWVRQVTRISIESAVEKADHSAN